MRWTMTILVLAAMAGSINAQEAPGNWEKRYYHKTIEHDRFDRDKWKEITGQLDYTEEDEDKNEEKMADEKGKEGGGEEGQSDASPNFYVPGAEYIMYGLGIIAIAVLLYYLVFKNLSRSGKKVRRRKSTLEEVEDDLEGSDVDPLLRQALNGGNYHLATRLYYMKCIQELSSAEFISWQRDKTNGEYLRELRDPILKPDFRHLTLQFELIWYGEYQVDRAGFEKLEEQFKTFLTTVENRKKQAA